MVKYGLTQPWFKILITFLNPKFGFDHIWPKHGFEQTSIF